MEHFPSRNNSPEPGAYLYLSPEDAATLHLEAAAATAPSGDPLLFGDWSVLHPGDAWNALTKLPNLERYGVNPDSLRKFGTVAVHAKTPSAAKRALGQPSYTSVELAVLRAPELPDTQDHEAA